MVERGSEGLHAFEREQTIGRLEPHHVAVVSGDANRSTGVGTESDVARSRAHERGGPTARAARGACWIEGIHGFGHTGVQCTGRVLQERGRRVDVGTRAAQGRNESRILGCRGSLLRLGVAVAARDTFDVEKVLHRNGHAMERSFEIALGSGQDVDDGVERPTQAFGTFVRVE